MRIPIFTAIAFGGWLFLLGAALYQPFRITTQAAWGVDARISSQKWALASKLSQASIAYLRQGEQPRLPKPDRLDTLARLRSLNYRSVGAVPWRDDLRRALLENIDLLDVYRKASYSGQTYANVMNFWELGNEPDIGFVCAMPDAYASWAKTAYLGLKHGTHRPYVLMGSLALPPGPWVERVSANGLFAYTDGWNFHYYGDPGDLADVIAWNKNHAGRLPLWITECGYRVKDLKLSEDNLQEQATYLRLCAETASNNHVSVFMPYVLFTPKRGWSLFHPDFSPRPAWNAYARVTETLSLRGPALKDQSGSSSPIVLQWRPDRLTCLPHKPSGTYRPRGNAPIQGTVRVHNFSEKAIQGYLKASPSSRLFLENISQKTFLTIAPHSYEDVSCMLRIPGPDYHRESISWNFEAEGDTHPSLLHFSLEQEPTGQAFDPFTLAMRPPSRDEFHYIGNRKDISIASSSTDWLGLNGLRHTLHQNGWILLDGPLSMDDDHPPMLVSKIDGLPDKSVLRLSCDRTLDKSTAFRVDLIDGHGRRFTMFENFGMGYFERGNQVWLDLRDFTPYFWGRATPHTPLNPAEVREIQIRPYLADGSKPVAIRLECFIPK